MAGNHGIFLVPFAATYCVEELEGNLAAFYHFHGANLQLNRKNENWVTELETAGTILFSINLPYLFRFMPTYPAQR